MKKFLIIFLIMFTLPVFADTLPYYTNNIPKSSIGVFQTGETLNIYTEPDEKSHIIKTYDFSYKPETMPDGVFCVLLNERKLGLMYVTDIGDDNWVQIIYDKHTGAKGWVMTEDRMQFMPWRNFYNLYGRKYGLRILKDAPDEISVLHAKSEDFSQNLDKLKYVKQIKLNLIRGNWALVSAMDIDKIVKTGYLKWRNTDGTIYAFPNIK